jgi:hypothetical protein
LGEIQARGLKDYEYDCPNNKLNSPSGSEEDSLDFLEGGKGKKIILNGEETDFYQ